jgi:parallel beta-helix repeat protein
MKAPRTTRRTRTAFAGTAAIAATLALSAGSASATGATCDLVAAPGGSDSAPGTLEQPLRTVQHLADSLGPDQTGCLRTGDYSDPSDDEVNLGVPGVTLTSYPGERATIHTRLWVEKTGDRVTISDLDLDGRNPTLLPSPTINADDVVLRGNDITNHHTAICVSLGSPDTWGRAHRTLIEQNRIHDCGVLPAKNMDHGIYVNSSDDAVIRNNLIYDNADRGIQLYQDAQHTTITGNIIDGNGEGVIFGGGDDHASSNNLVAHNVITNSKLRDNIESSYGPHIGTGNVARENCVGGGAYDDGDGGVLRDGPPAEIGFRAVDNFVIEPRYANAARGDYSVPASSPCAAWVANVPGASAQPASATPPALPAVTIATNTNEVAPKTPVRVTGTAPGAKRVMLVVRRDGVWHRLGVTRHTHGKGGKYRAKVRLARSGRQTLKAVATGLRDSKRVKIRVKQRRRG